MGECGLGISVVHELMRYPNRYHIVAKPFDIPQVRDIGIAVNKYPKAPIMEMADYAVEADLKEFLPLLIEKIKALKSK